MRLLSKGSLLILLLCTILAITSFAQVSKNDSLNIFTEVLRKYPQEKVYLHYDRQHYHVGDTVYFSAYVLFGSKHILSPVSGVLYVDVLKDDSATISSLKLKLVNGRSYGSFAIPVNMPSGNLHVRAYTKWMLNEKQPAGFDDISVTGLTVAAKRINVDRVPQITFMPEGGSLVNGVLSKIAFKSVGANGMGMEASGQISDNNKKTVASFTTAHLGMGQFTFIPEKGQRYYADVAFSNGVKSHVALPAATDNGLTLKIVANDPGKILVEVNASPAYFAAHKDETITIVSQWQGKAGWFTGKLSASSIRFQLKENYPSGVLILTLLNAAMQPQSERLVFVNNKTDQLNLSVSTDKPVYHTFETVTVDLSVKDANQLPAAGSFSIAVTQNDSTESMLAGLLLNADLKGYLENPDYYFDERNANAANALDLVMMTHGYRHYTVKEFLKGEIPAVSFSPEKALTVSGFLKTSKGKPLVHKKVSLSDPVGQGAGLEALTNDKGFFVFKNIVYNDSTAFKITSDEYDAKIIPFTGMVKPIMDEMPATASIGTLTADERAMISLQNLSSLNLNGKTLKEVQIRARKKEEVYETRSLAGAGNADQVIQIKDIQGGGSPADVLNGRLRGVVFVNGFPYLETSLQMVMGANPPKPMLIIIDGAEGSSSPASRGLDDLSLRDIKTVEVLKSANASIYGMQAGGGVLVITTMRGEAAEVIAASELSFKNMGFNVSKDFYMPKYTPDAKADNPLNYRKIIFWKPEVNIGTDGKGHFTFQQNGLTGNFSVTVNGISTEGKPGTSTFNYTITK